MNETYPVIRLEVQGMKHAIQIALSEHLIKMDMDIQSAIDRVCTPTNISAIVFDAAQNFYRYGDGREAIKEAVERQLKGESNE
jgi:hypothetical protein